MQILSLPVCRKESRRLAFQFGLSFIKIWVGGALLKLSEIIYLEAHLNSHYEHAAILFSEYAESLEFSLDFQDFEKELAEMPGEYARPDGSIILAYSGEKPAGCVALRPLDSDFCEMKRLYVRPEFRGLEIGKNLSRMIVKKARELGYMKMRLDTVSSMTRAMAIYRKMGFRDIDPYRFNPFNDAVFMELDLI